MNDAAYEAQKARILALGKKWIHSLGFGVWTVTYVWHRGPIPGAMPERDDQVVLFKIDAEWAYLRVEISVNLAEAEHLDEIDLETHFLHEWGHAFLSVVLHTPVEGDGVARYRATEHVCTWLGKAFRWVRLAGMKDEKKRRKAKKRAKAAPAGA